MAPEDKTDWLVGCHEEWIRDEGKPAVLWINQAKAQLNLTKWLLGLVFGGELLTVALLIFRH